MPFLKFRAVDQFHIVQFDLIHFAKSNGVRCTLQSAQDDADAFAQRIQYFGRSIKVGADPNTRIVKFELDFVPLGSPQYFRFLQGMGRNELGTTRIVGRTLGLVLVDNGHIGAHGEIGMRESHPVHVTKRLFAVIPLGDHFARHGRGGRRIFFDLKTGAKSEIVYIHRVPSDSSRVYIPTLLREFQFAGRRLERRWHVQDLLETVVPAILLDQIQSQQFRANITLWWTI